MSYQMDALLDKLKVATREASKAAQARHNASVALEAAEARMSRALDRENELFRLINQLHKELS